MATIFKYNHLTNFNNSSFIIINLNSNINIKNVTIENATPVFNINNGITNIILSKFSNTITSSTITINNSSNYIDDIDFNNNTTLFVEKGSLYNYGNELIYTSSFLQKSNNELLLIPSSINICKSSKTEYIKYNPEVRNLSTGNENYSTHYLTNSIYGYWGNKYGGEFTNDTEIVANSTNDLNRVLNFIPRNLNGYKVSIKLNGNIDDLSIKILNIINFNNGILNIKFEENTYDLKFNITNNSAKINILATKCNFVTFLMEDNEDISLTTKILKNIFIKGVNNILTLAVKYCDNLDDNTKNINNTIELFTDTNSFSNKIYITYLENVTGIDVITSILASNDLYRGNYYYIKDIPSTIGNLVNDKDISNEDYIDLNNKYNTEFIIDEVYPLSSNRDISDIGTIIGWNADLPIPRGYYKCNGEKISIDIHNPEDEFYNGMLAYYLNANLNESTFTLPNIPSATPKKIAQDPNYVFLNQYIGDAYAGIIYIIKYNNNFENKKAR